MLDFYHLEVFSATYKRFLYIENTKTFWYDYFMKPRIYYEIKEFLAKTGMPASTLARAAGIVPVTITRLMSGERKDMVSASADALRDAMRRLTTPIPSSTDKHAGEKRNVLL